MRMKDIPYEGTIESGGQTIQFRKAAPADAGQLARLYRGTAVTAENYGERLSADSPLSFDKRGGMFLIMEEEEIVRELDNPHSFWVVFTEREEVIGSFWFADDNHLLPGKFRPGGSAVKGRALYPREVIVSPKWKGRKIGMLLYATVFAAMYRAGIEESICDVYRVTAFRAQGEEKQQVSLLNAPSSHAILRTGGSFAEAGEEKVITLPGLMVWIEPQIYRISHSRAILLSAHIFQGRGIMIKEKINGKNGA